MLVRHQTFKRQAHRTCTTGRGEERHSEKEDSDTTESRCSTEEPNPLSAEQKNTSTDQSRKSPESSYSPPLSEENSKGDSAVQTCSPTTICKRVAPKRSKGAHRAGCQCKQNRIGRAPMVPPLGPPYCPRQRIASAHEQHIKQLHNQVWDLEQQLCAASQENRLLRRLQGRHVAALRHYQDSQASLPQTLRRHSSEARALRELLRGARAHNHQLTRRLRRSETELLHASHTLGHLQQLSQDHSLEEREKLSRRLSLLTEELREKNQKIQDLQRNLTLNNAYFNRQLSAEMRKAIDAREFSMCLENQINDLTQRIKEREKELQIHNIYSHRFPKGRSKRVSGTTDTKSVQTDKVSPLCIEAPLCPLEIEYPNEQQAQTGLEVNHRSTWEFYTNERGTNSSSEEEEARDGGEEEHRAPAHEKENNGTDRLKMEHNGEQVEEEEEDGLSQASASAPLASAEDNNELSFHSLTITQSPPASKAPKSPVKIRRHYTFKETIQNLHSGKPAYAVTPCNTQSFHRHHNPRTSPIRLETGAYEPSFGPPAAPRPCRLGPEPAEQAHDIRKSNLMMELFGQVRGGADE